MERRTCHGDFRACTWWLPVSQRVKNEDSRVVFAVPVSCKLTEVSLKSVCLFLSAATEIWSLCWLLVAGILALRSKSFYGQNMRVEAKGRILQAGVGKCDTSG